VNPVPRAQLNAMYALSQAMVSKSPTGPDMESDPLFELVNRDAICALFEYGLMPQLGERWTKHVSEATNPHDQLVCWMRGYPLSEITATLEQAILDKGIGPEMIPDPPAAKIIAQGSAALQLLMSMWSLQVPDKNVLAQVDENDLSDVLGLILRRGVHKNLTFLPVLAFFKDHLSPVAKEPKVAENLRYYIESKVPALYADFKLGMVTTVIELGDYDCLVDRPIDWLMHLNRWFALTGGDPTSWKAAKRLGKTEDFSKYGNIRAFALGTSLPLEMERKGEGRNGLLRALITVHGYKEEQLMDMGFFKAEIQAAGGRIGIINKIKGLFGL
jgi:hypothetical protein